MKKRNVILVLAFASVLALAAGLEAQARHELTVNVPFAFVAAGKLMPAGTYTVNRLSAEGLGGLLLSSYDSKANVIVLPIEFNSNSRGALKLAFEQVGEERFLNRVETDNGAYHVSISRSVAVVAGMKRHRDMSTPGGQ